jgi:hypothetical protein
MNTRGVLGKKIVGVEQVSAMTNVGRRWHVSALVLEDGTRLVPEVCETPCDGYVIEVKVRTP